MSAHLDEMELQALAGTRAILEADDAGGGFSEQPVSDAAEILKLAQARCDEIGPVLNAAALAS